MPAFSLTQFISVNEQRYLRKKTQVNVESFIACDNVNTWIIKKSIIKMSVLIMVRLNY